MIDRVTEHAKSVVEGITPAGHYHYLACKRHLEDLDRQKTKDFPYYWDVKASERILNYAETLTIAEGDGLKPVKLIPEQCFDIGAPFGWKKNNGYRKYRVKYESEARQNGKTFKNGIYGTYIGGFGGYNYGKLFTVATKKRQARLAWEEMAKFIRTDQDLQELFDIKDYKSLINCKLTNCTIEALSKEAGLDDGFRSIFSSIDEIHQHKDNKVYKAIYNGTAALDETLVSMITTRGEDLNSFCYEIDAYSIGILERTITAEDFFVDIYCLDKDDDYFDESNWYKANPFLATTEKGMETLRQDAQRAKDMGGSDLRDFITKRLNMWCRNFDDQFIDVEKWKECGTNKTLEDMKGKECYVGIDLSSGGDLTSISLEFPLENDKFYIYSHSFMPKGRLEEHIESDLAPYDLWVQNDLLTVTGGVNEYKNDYKFIIAHLKELVKKFDLKIKAIGYDPHNADGFLSDLEEFGCNLIMITQSARFLNDATVDTQLNVKSNKIEYFKGNELLSWSFSNAKVVANSFGEIKVDKEPKSRYKRIDPVDSVIDAHVAYMKMKDDEIDYEKEMQNYLDMMNWKNE